MKINSNTMLPGLPSPLTERATWVFFVVAFLATCGLALTIQLVLLPHFLPQLNAGHGMLVGGDSAGMHSTAVAMAERIRAEGWSAWELRPAGNAPTGIAAALYVFVAPKPFMLVPLNALVHAGSGLVIYLMAYYLSRHKLASVAAAIPFLVFPSAASWYAQIHKDGIFALGMLLCAMGWMHAFRRDFWLAPMPRFLALFMPIAFGLFLIWVVRPHIMVLMQVVAIVVTLWGFGLVALWWRRRALSGERALLAALIFVVIPILIVIVKPTDYRVESWKGSVVERESTMRYMAGACFLERGFSMGADKLSSTVAAMRDFYISGYRSAKSNMDPEFVPGTVCNLLAYVPRALQIGFLAPFPNAWLADGSVAASTLMRRVVSFEMLATYVGLLMLPLALWDYRRMPEFWFVLGFFTLLMVIHVYLVPNLGTLHRMRYGFLTAIVGLAVSAGARRLLFRTASYVGYRPV